MANEEPINESMEARFAWRITDRHTGALEVRDGKRKRVFFFRDGALVLSWSNLKSETAEQVKKRFSDAEAAEIPRLQAVLRLMACIRARDPAVRWHPDRAPPREIPVDGRSVLWEAVDLAIPGQTARERLEALEGSRPVAGGPQDTPLELLPAPESLRVWMETFDGQRALDDVLEFAPGDGEGVIRALYLGVLLGAVRMHAGPATHEVRVASGGHAEAEGPAPSPDPGPDASPSGTEPGPPVQSDDAFSEMIAQGVQAARQAAPATEPSAEAGPQAASAAAEPEAPAEGAEEPPPDEETRELVAEMDRIEAADDYFGVLGVSWDADPSAFRGAYFELARLLHPDRLIHLDEQAQQRASDAFDRAREAWETLKEDDSREEYTDRVIHGKKTEDELAMERVQEILDAEATFKRGLAAFNAGQVVKAHEAFEEAFDAVPEETEFRAYFGYTLYRTHVGSDEERAADGVQLIREAVDKAPKLDSAWVLMGRVYREREDHTRARRCFIQALRVNAANADATRELERYKRQKKNKGKKSGGFLGSLFGRKKGKDKKG